MTRSAACVSNASHQPSMTARTLNYSVGANVTHVGIGFTWPSATRKGFCVAVTRFVAVIVAEIKFP
ncbi:hypothetical protein DPMN_173972 [Dreissena polymorpha]|uniref:Uncharacterized protein n=1 Tax=Dreissena polymorpha TaxID=45954 RepID=A0A9D4E5C4_DREPO|nr:hypothetical protein DPMN_173972 [Dreissena polymorpha]